MINNNYENFKNLFNLKNRTVVLTGAELSCRKISLILADLGANLILISRSKNFKNNYDKKISLQYPNIKIKKIICDLSKEKIDQNLLKT